ncbi:hypothetical protein [Bailinhaonella thermotolerans]|uniref:Uncharacterized protein n=1 Tax=Bailinhaonella thermotolerans TaxID=1070861 RepID=A0A3A4B0M3_9ACTN|nr:hypothetical protein [Bailinhaonella thermotolerans]RJL25162.1 hypothetical protein D5H75_27915 [Bailinhaonella thermotolerans]
MRGGRYDVVGSGPDEPDPRRERLRRALAVGGAAVVVIGFGVYQAQRPDPPEPAPTRGPVVTPTVEAAAAGRNAVFPAARRRGDTEIVRVTFPDGVSAELRYPRSLAVASLGASPVVGAWLGTDMTTYRQLVAPPRGEASLAEGGSRIRDMTPTVSLWPSAPYVPLGGHVLLFEFGRWRMALHDVDEGLTFEQRMEWARNLRGRVTRDGFLVLRADGPLRLAPAGKRMGSELAGPQLHFGAGSRDRQVWIVRQPGCRGVEDPPMRLVSLNRPYAGRCRGDFYLAAAGDLPFVQAVVRNLRVRRVA